MGMAFQNKTLLHIGMIKYAAILLPMLTVNALATVAEWVPVGRSELGDWQVYVRRDSLTANKQGRITVFILDDYKVTQLGIMRFYPNGEMVNDDRYRYRSTVSKLVFDCAKRREAGLETWYFAGDMGNGELVFDDKEGDPGWTNVYFMPETRVAKFVCDKRNLQQSP